MIGWIVTLVEDAEDDVNRQQRGGDQPWLRRQRIWSYNACAVPAKLLPWTLDGILASVSIWFDWLSRHRLNAAAGRQIEGEASPLRELSLVVHRDRRGGWLVMRQWRPAAPWRVLFVACI